MLHLIPLQENFSAKFKMERCVHEYVRFMSLSFSQLLSKNSSKLFADKQFQNSLDDILSNFLSTWRLEISQNKKLTMLQYLGMKH